MREENSDRDRGGKMRQSDAYPLDNPAIKIFERYGSCSGIIYTCRIFSECSPTDMSMRCLAWVCMN